MLCRGTSVLFWCWILIIPQKRHEAEAGWQKTPSQLLQLFQRRTHPRFLTLCRNQPAIAVAAYEGIEDSMKECRHHMYYNPWDCTQLNTVLHGSPILHTGTREAAYLWALSSSGAAWGVATACAAGWLNECTCDVTVGNKQGYEWGGCLQGVTFGLKIARKMLTRPGDGTLLRDVEKHNLKVGRMMIRKTLVQDCKCHGVSGSCDQKTCYHKPAHLKTIAAHLTKKFHKAKRVTRDTMKGKNTELIYIEETPNPCLTRKSSNRVCAWRNGTHEKGDCKRLCCGRGAKKSTELESQPCRCQFIWCCGIQCNTCFSHVTLYTCK